MTLAEAEAAGYRLVKGREGRTQKLGPFTVSEPGEPWTLEGTEGGGLRRFSGMTLEAALSALEEHLTKRAADEARPVVN